MPHTTDIETITIIGSGAAGLTAAIYAARANMKPLVLAGLQPGGQLTITTDVENYPGFAEVVQGPWLMEQMQAQAESVGARIQYELVEAVDFNGGGASRTGDAHTLILDGGRKIQSKSVVIATGAQARWLGIDSEARFNGRGVSACATCDGFFFRDKAVAVIGGGNTAVEEALYLSKICKKVILVHRRDSLRAEQLMQERLARTGNIEVLWNRVVEEVLGGEKVTGVRLASTAGEDMAQIKLDGVFVAIGHDPATAAFKGAVDMDDEGYIRVATGGTQTSQPGVFAAGDCVDKIYRQAVTAAGMGCMSALDAERWLGARE